MPSLKDIDSFLVEHKQEIFKSPMFSYKRKILFKFYFINKQLFKQVVLVNQKINKLLKQWMVLVYKNGHEKFNRLKSI